MGRFWYQGSGNPSVRRGFSLIELLAVLSLLALLTSLVVFHVRPEPQQQLVREGDRLALWFEAARIQARVQNLTIQARISAEGFELLGAVPPDQPAPKLLWLYPNTHATMNSPTISLGPEPMLQAQSLWLQNPDQPDMRVHVASNGVGPWRVLR